jgi:dTDP-4-amino-4,6-dideoxygalactose transaminase
MPCDLARIVPIAEKHSIPLVEDAACALGSEIFWDGKWERIGKPHGDVACFSFHPRKVVSTGDGGMLTSKHKDWDTKFRLLRQHGMSVTDAVRHSSHEIIFEAFPELGYNYRLTDVQAAIGREQLKRLPEMIERRRELASRYVTLLQNIPGLHLPTEPEWGRSNWQSYCVRLPAGAPQKKVMQLMRDGGIATRRGIMCVHREPAYEKEKWRAAGPLTQGERAQEECILLPLYHQLTDQEQQLVASQLQSALASTSVP